MQTYRLTFSRFNQRESVDESSFCHLALNAKLIGTIGLFTPRCEKMSERRSKRRADADDRAASLTDGHRE